MRVDSSFYLSVSMSIALTLILSVGANFVQSSLFGMDADLDQSQMKRLYLGNKGGVTFFAPLVAYFVFYIVTSMF